MKLRIRRRWLVTLLLGSVALGAYVLLTRHRIDEAHFKMIEEEMTYAEVEAIFGAPPGEYDWAERDDDRIWTADFAIIKYTVPTKSAKYIVTTPSISVDGAAFKLADAADVQLVTVLWDRRITKTWTSRHGSFEIAFDKDDRVAWTNHQTEVRIAWPWLRAWRWWKSR